MLTPAQSRAARALVEMSQEQLAAAAHLGLSTVRDMEKGRRVPTHNNLVAIRAALEVAGVEFIPENGGGAGVRLRDPTSANLREGAALVRQAKPARDAPAINPQGLADGLESKPHARDGRSQTDARPTNDGE